MIPAYSCLLHVDHFWESALIFVSPRKFQNAQLTLNKAVIRSWIILRDAKLPSVAANLAGNGYLSCNLLTWGIGEAFAAIKLDDLQLYYVLTPGNSNTSHPSSCQLKDLLGNPVVTMSSCFAIKGFEIPEELYTVSDITECWCHFLCDTDVMLCYTHHLLNRGS